MNTRLTKLLENIQDSKDRLYSHSLYNQLTNIESLKQFMQYHAYAVWDFMNLLSSLQSEFTSCTAPWTPPKHPKVARLINEIKLEEESDIIENTVTSHFTYYVDSMDKLNINTANIKQFINDTKQNNYNSLINKSYLSNTVKDFLKATQHSIEQGPVATAASFTFGREIIIPDMFVNILSNAEQSTQIQAFRNYLERHIELDGNEHSKLALDLITELCGNDEKKWQQATEYAIKAINARVSFYNDIANKL